MIKKTKNKKGSVLVFTLFIMVLVLITGISLVTVSLSGRRSTMSSSKSVNAFQVADSGLEAALAEIKDAPAGTLISAVLGSSCIDGGDPIIRENISDGSYEVWFYDGPDDPSYPPNMLDCSDLVSDIRRVKSTGVYKNTTRSVETEITTTP